MTRSILVMMAALALVGCKDKPAEEATPAEPSVVVPEEAKPEQAATDKPAEVAEKPAAMPENLEPGEQGFYGAKFTVIEEPITLAQAMERTKAEKAPPTVKVQATVKSVCKKKGCWFTMAGEGVEEDVRVRMKDYSFFVPKNSEEAQVVAEGTLTQREVPQDEAQHYADDAAKAGEEPKKVEGPQQAWEFTATAIELQAAES